MFKCPECEGRGPALGIACGDKGCRPMLMSCFLCGGKGEIDEEQVEWIEVGHKMRDKRKARGEILRQGAERYGIPQSDLSYIETGRVEPWRSVKPCDPGDFGGKGAICVVCKHKALCRDLVEVMDEYQRECEGE